MRRIERMADYAAFRVLTLDCMVLIVNPDELDAMIESCGVALSRSAKSLILKSGRSGPFSWTKSAFDTALFRSVVKSRCLSGGVW